MQRNLWLWHGPQGSGLQLEQFSAEQQRHLCELLSQLGLNIVREARGPVPLLIFGQRVLECLHEHYYEVPLPQFADGLKHVIRQMRHDRLQVMSPSDSPGIGYVYNAQDPQTWPLRSRH